jgi:acyl carrier protein
MESSSYEDILARCIQLIAATTKLPPESISASSTFDSLGIDSLEKINLSFEVEEAFHIAIPDKALSSILTVKDMANGVQQLMSQRASVPGATA